ncbi:MAG: FimB/Mfa2 family fimbrial subunit [Bacteroides sp.]|nr:FimB/Mfa2 family fimbrial subunit [Bacteroides sp.]
MKINRITIGIAGVLLMGTGCDVKDPIYYTPHPDHGKIVLTTGWSDRPVGVEIPGRYTVQVGDYREEVSGTTSVLDHLFEAGTYAVHVYNPSEYITVEGTVARVARVSGRDGAEEATFIYPTPEWFFSCATEVTVEKDHVHTLTASMRQQIRQLTLVVEPEGVDPEQILSIEGWLTGVAGELDIDQELHTGTSDVALEFAQIADGADPGKWSVTVRLLGISGADQTLCVCLYLAGSGSHAIRVDSDLSTALSDFNNDKKTPLSLTARLVIVPDPEVEAGFTATIEDWKTGGGGSGIAT